MIIDTQVHIWEKHRPGRPWPEPVVPKPGWPDGLSAERMLTEMDAIGVDRTVIVPPIWAGDSNETGLEAAQRYPDRFAVMGRFDPLAPGISGRLKDWLQQPHMLGIRMSLNRPPHSNWLDDGTLDEFWSACEHFGIPVMVFIGRTVEKLQAVVQAHPGLTLIIDHMGCDLGAKGAQAFSQLDSVLALARHTNVSLKLSMAPRFSEVPYPYHDINPFIWRIYETIGPQRLMWGSDFTNLSSYEDCLRHVQEGLDFLSEEDRKWILGKTAATLLKWP